MKQFEMSESQRQFRARHHVKETGWARKQREVAFVEKAASEWKAKGYSADEMFVAEHFVVIHVGGEQAA